MRALAFALLCLGSPAGAQEMTARYLEPTTRYPHAVLGDDVEYGALEVTVDGGRFVHRLPRVLVFEDLAPRLADVTGDGLPEIITVEAHRTLGARLAVWTAEGRLAATPHIGRAFRWLAPVGVGDFDGDGHPDIAYVETPHLGRTLRFWTYRDGALHQIASAPGYTNHRIGEDFITSAVRSCTGMDEAVTVNAGYTRILASQVRDGMVVSRDVGPFRGRGSVEAAARC